MFNVLPFVRVVVVVSFEAVVVPSVSVVIPIVLSAGESGVATESGNIECAERTVHII